MENLDLIFFFGENPSWGSEDEYFVQTAASGRLIGSIPFFITSIRLLKFKIL